jgi:hypothetical protein
MGILDILKMIIDKGPEMIGYGAIAFGGFLSIAMIIPGEQPDKFLQSIVDFLNKFSKK